MEITDFKYYNLCLPRKILDESKMIAAKQGITLKEYFAKIVVDGNKREKERVENAEK